MKERRRDQVGAGIVAQGAGRRLQRVVVAVDPVTEGRAPKALEELFTAKFAEANPKTIAAFARAVERGAKDATNRKLVEQTIPTYTTIDKQTAALLDLPLYPTSLDAKRLQRVADLMQQFGLLSNHLDVSTMIVASPPAQ